MANTWLVKDQANEMQKNLKKCLGDRDIEVDSRASYEVTIINESPLSPVKRLIRTTKCATYGAVAPLRPTKVGLR